MKISIIQPSRNNLVYLKWSYDSIRKNQGDHIVQICVADDYSDDGTWRWCEETMKVDPHFNAIRNDGPNRLGHTILYDRLVNEVAKYDLCMIYHADMYLCPGALDAIERHMYVDLHVPTLPVEPGVSPMSSNIKERRKKTIVSLTRIEPPLHPPGPEKIILDCGTEPDMFNEPLLLSVLNSKVVQKENVGKDLTTEGIFAPWAFWKDEFQQIGGHDKLFAPQSKEDSMVGSTLVLISQNSFRRIVRVSDIWDMYESEIQSRSDGKEYIDLREKNIRVMTPLHNGEIGIRKLNGIIRHSVDVNNIVTIRTRSGLVSVTRDHSLISDTLDEITSRDINEHGSMLWTPNRLLDWSRREQLESLIFEPINDTPRTNRNDYEFPSFDNIDEYGGDLQLRSLCDFLGFYVAEGSTNDGYVKICGSNYDELAYYASIFCDIFNADPVSCVTSSKDNGDDVYSYTWGSKYLASIFREMVGHNSSTKKVPDFIFNLPKIYQNYFLYGYLRGDGYLGTSISYTGYDQQTMISVDKRLFFKKDSLKLFTWKSTSSSDILTTGLYYLLMRCHPECRYRINYQNNKNVYTLDSYKDDRQVLSSVMDYTSTFSDVFVYDLEVEDTNMFIGGVGFVGLHNSDIFNRFQLNGIKFIQTWAGFVYHMTCRGSRFNPTLTTIGTNSDEWTAQNIRSARNFVRKWGSYVRHDTYMKPIVPPKYDVGIELYFGDYNMLKELEPWCSTIYTQNKSACDRYIEEEQFNTRYDMSSRVKCGIPDTPQHDITVRIKRPIDADDFKYLQMLPDIIQDSGEEDSTMSLGNLEFVIGKLRTYERELIVVK